MDSNQFGCFLSLLSLSLSSSTSIHGTLTFLHTWLVPRLLSFPPPYYDYYIHNIGPFIIVIVIVRPLTTLPRVLALIIIASFFLIPSSSTYNVHTYIPTLTTLTTLHYILLGKQLIITINFVPGSRWSG